MGRDAPLQNTAENGVAPIGYIRYIRYIGYIPGLPGHILRGTELRGLEVGQTQRHTRPHQRHIIARVHNVQRLDDALPVDHIARVHAHHRIAARSLNARHTRLPHAQRLSVLAQVYARVFY